MKENIVVWISDDQSRYIDMTPWAKSQAYVRHMTIHSPCRNYPRGRHECDWDDQISRRDLSRWISRNV